MQQQCPRRRWLAPILIIIGAVLLTLTGCSTQSGYTIREGDLASRFLPSPRTVAHHPDSLRALTVQVEEDSSVSYELAEGYEALWRKWSSTYQNLGTGRSRRRPLSYATFWSLELSLASLQPEVGVNGLTADRAQEVLRERRQEYQETVQVDVYWFEAEGNSILAGAGTRVRLRIDGTEYKPRKEDYGPLREAFLPGGETALYRRNTFYFPRVVEGRDILDDTDSVGLMVQARGRAARVLFQWEWPEG
jgi:hypothetical protein